jgi:hypothetical protein
MNGGVRACGTNDGYCPKNYGATCETPDPDCQPIITISSPTNTTYSITSVWNNVTLDMAGSWCGVSIDGAANATMTNSSGKWNYQKTGLENGVSHTAKFYCNNTNNKWNSTNVVVFTTNNSAPTADSSISPASTHNLLQSMSWTEGTDVEGDTVSSWYCIASSAANRNSENCDVHAMTSSVDPPHSFGNGELSYGGATKTYYGRLIATDGISNATAYDFSFDLTNAQPSAPSSASLAGQTTNDTTPTITFTKGTDSDTTPADTVTQYVSVDSSGYTDSGNIYTTSGDINQFSIASELSDGTYYVRQWANDGTGATNARSNNYQYTFIVKADAIVQSMTIQPDEGDPGTIINPIENSNKSVNATIEISNSTVISSCQIKIFNSTTSYSSPVFSYAGTIQNCGSTCDCFKEWDMEYWRNDGQWNVSVDISLSNGGTNFTSQNFTYNSLTSINVNTSTITFTGVPDQTVNSIDAYPLEIKNTGNQLVDIKINGTDFQGLTNSNYVVGVGNSTYNETVTGNFDKLTNSAVQIFSNLAPSLIKNLYFRAYLPVGFINQDYQNYIEIRGD